jgi:ferritin-like metal-binding protein YciE
MNESQLHELLLQALEHERGGVKVYKAALKCARHPELKQEWTKYLGQTENHVVVLSNVCTALGIDPGMQTPGCKIVKDLGASLVIAMETALSAGNPAAAQIVACDCVTLAETKDHANWELIGEAAKALEENKAKVLADAYGQIEDEEDEHLYHTKGWGRELWLESLGMQAVLPPPEETDHATTAVEAARAKVTADTARETHR